MRPLPADGLAPALGRALRLRGSHLAGGGVAVGLAALAATDGGYFPVSWGWSALLLLLTAGAAVLVRTRSRLEVLDRVMLVGIAGLVAWVALSAIWSISLPRTMLEVQRDLVYLAAVVVLLTTMRKAWVPQLIGGAFAAITAVSAYALWTRLFPSEAADAFAANRLYEPFGYWNALGIFASMGVLLALGLATRGSRLWARGLAAAALPILLPTVYFTFSRGSLIALIVGLGATLALDPRRLRLIAGSLVVLPPAALALLLSSRADGLTRQSATLAEAAHDGHLLAAAIIGLAAVAAAAAIGFALLERRIRPTRTMRRSFAALVAVAVLVAGAGLVRTHGNPATMATRAYDSFTSPPKATGGNLHNRLFDLSSDGRIALWRVGWEDVKSHPVLGSGAGTYEPFYLQHRVTDSKVRDAHNLYLEVLAELGPVGLALLLVLLGTPVVAAVRSRRHPLVPVALGAFVAYLLHAAADWDWEMAALTLTALSLGAALVVAARSERATRPVRRPLRIGGVATIVALAAFAFVGLVGNAALSSASTSAGEMGWSSSEASARRATAWAPWASTPWVLLGDAQRSQGDLAAAMASFGTAIARDPHDYEPWLELARTTAGRDQSQALTEAIRLNPRSPEIADFRRALLGG